MNAFLAWLKRPFSPDMSAGQWFLFFGLLIVIAAFWHMIIRAFTNVTEG